MENQSQHQIAHNSHKHCVLSLIFIYSSQMKVLVFTFAFFSSFLTFSSHADETKGLSLLGRGIYNKASREIIAIACVDTTCTQIQFTLLSLDQDHSEMKVEWLGSPLEVPAAPTEELKAAATTAMLEAYLNTIQSYQQRKVKEERSDRIRNRFSWGVMIATGMVAGALGPVTLTGAIAIMTPLLITGILVRAFPPKSLERLLSQSLNMNHITETGTNRDGWNWSIKPKKLKSKKFEELLANLRNPANSHDLNYGSPYQRARDKMDRLEKKGVNFPRIP